MSIYAKHSNCHYQFITVIDLQGLKLKFEREKEIKIIVNSSLPSFRIIDVLSVGSGPHPHLLLVGVIFAISRENKFSETLMKG